MFVLTMNVLANIVYLFYGLLDAMVLFLHSNVIFEKTQHFVVCINIKRYALICFNFRYLGNVVLKNACLANLY